MIPFLIYVDVTFKSYLVLCKGLMLWTLVQVTPSWSSCSDVHTLTVTGKLLLQRQFSANVPKSLTEKSQESQWLMAYAVLNIFWLETENGMVVGGGAYSFLFLFTLWIAVVVPWQAASTSGRKAVLHGGTMLAQHFPGMLAPSAQAENFASANCDFRTQVCSWTWMPSCQCVAICHQHMAP